MYVVMWGCGCKVGEGCGCEVSEEVYGCGCGSRDVLL